MDHEDKRLEALRSYGLADEPFEPQFQTIVNTATLALNVPIAAVSLIESERQWFKAEFGLGVKENPRSIAFCSHTIESEDPLIVPDARLDARFRDNPLVTGAPHIRFYAGVPIVDADGYALGAFCIIDREPRNPSDDELTMLWGFSRFALTALESHKRALALKQE